ncbi:MAG: zinc dependent phospholipase C family protein, partial [Pirellulaceae bacterium]|nr:zinc dependent phospholipase C family protein [Pirellulaceae bacterium]
MAELLEVLFRTECTSTHHKLALDALRHLKGSHAEAWRNLFLKHFDVYLDGSKAPDKVFKDFCNHVIHVGDNYWGGAVGEAEKWYEATVRELKSKNWSEAIYSAGVLSHYYTDPIQPLHTAQSEREGKVHRALEWSIAKSYDELREILEQDLGGYPTVRVPGAANWLEEMVLAGAEQAYPHYEMLIDHYDLAKGAKNPPAGLDQESKDCLAKLIGHASAGFAGILDKAFDEAGVKPPNAGTSLVSYLAHLTIPIAWVLRKLTDRKDRSQVRAIHDEVKRTGRALRTLPDDERTVRELHAKEVLETPLAELNKQEVGETGGKHTQGASPRVRRQKPGRTATPNKRDKKRKPNRDHDSLTVDQKRDKKANKKRDKK